MPTNHPWRTKSREFTCEPDCPKRKPACQDHCEKHQREKAEHERKKRIYDEQRHIDGYASGMILNSRNASAKRAKKSRPIPHYGD